MKLSSVAAVRCGSQGAFAGAATCLDYGAFFLAKASRAAYVTLFGAALSAFNVAALVALQERPRVHANF